MINQKDARDDLKYIKKTIEESGTYTNIPAYGYISAGIFGIIGCYLTYLRIGLSSLKNIGDRNIMFLSLVWATVFILSVFAVIIFTRLGAKKSNRSSWSSLASRVFLSQIPMIVATGILTLAFTMKGAYEFIPPVWLLGYSIILFSFSYFTGGEHKIQGAAFMILGAASAFMHSSLSLIFLTIGFGGVNIIFGIKRFLHQNKESGARDAR